jgi:CheY-like chemotaxis protein
VLVVDDEAVIRQLIVINLELEGFEVHEAVDGLDALEKAREIDPDVVTLDVMMPGLDGMTTARRLRSDPADEAGPDRADQRADPAGGPGAGRGGGRRTTT